MFRSWMGAGVALVVAGLTMTACAEVIPDEPPPSDPPTTPVADPSGGVVAITGERTFATGVVLAADGDILAIGEFDGPVTVTFHDREEREAVVVASDPRTRLVVVRVAGGADLTPVSFAATDIDVGEGVRLLLSDAHPEGESERSGTIVATGLSFGAVSVIETDIPITLSAGGAPYVNEAGEVVGVVAGSIRTASAQEGAGLALPAVVAARVAGQLAAGGPVIHPYLGVSVSDVDNGGVVVQDVPAGGPADQAGLRPGDVITQIGDHPVRSAGEVIYAVQAHAAGDEVTVVYTRDGDAHETTTTLGEASEG